LFTTLPKEKEKTLLKKTDILNFSKFSWPLETEEELTLNAHSLQPASASKLDSLKSELAGWFEKHHGVQLDPDKEIYIGSGVRNLILNIGLAFIDRGELAFVPELGYPHYKRTVVACGGDTILYRVSAKSDWLPDFSTVSSPIGRIARLLFLNSPHNPTGAVSNEKELNKLAAVAAKENVMIINDAAYQSLSDAKPPSLLSVKAGTKIGAEVYSLAYTLGLPALPFGFVAGHSEIINGLNQIASLSPQPVLNLFCELALEAIRKFPNQALLAMRRRISDSRAEAMKLFDLLELEPSGYNTVPFLLGRIAGRRSSLVAAKILYHGAKIVALPGSEFGEGGEGYLRFSLTAPPETYVKAIQRVRKRQRLFRRNED
jgi:LL-diaminopimelate aminotransferase